MTVYIIRRLTQSFLVLILVTLIVFFTMRLLPGDPILILITSEEMEETSQEQIAILRHEFGLDKPIILQYVDWIKGIVHGDLGISIINQESVLEEIVRRVPITLHIGILAFVISGVVGIFFGVLSAVRRGDLVDSGVTVLANIGITVPNFWLGILLVYFFALKLRWLPVYGYTSPFDNFFLNTRQIIMPVFCLSIFGIASAARQTRSSMLEVLHQDYIRTAWSKGLKHKIVILRHALKNALIPVITLKGMAFSHILGGSVLIETVYNIPGMGRLAVDAILNQDYAVVQGIILVTALTVMLANFIVDISYGWLDPRIRYT